MGGDRDLFGAYAGGLMTLKRDILWEETPGHLETPLPVTGKLSLPPPHPSSSAPSGFLVLPGLRVAAGELSWGGGGGEGSRTN